MRDFIEFAVYVRRFTFADILLGSFALMDLSAGRWIWCLLDIAVALTLACVGEIMFDPSLDVEDDQ